MSFTITCPGCGGLLSYGPELFGKAGRCPTCGHEMVFPTVPGAQVSSGQAVCEACGTPKTPDGEFCPNCGHRYGAAPPEPIPWETATKQNWWGPLKETVRLMFRGSAEFYRRMPTRGGIVRPMLFGAIIGTVVTWATQVTMMLGMMLIFGIAGAAGDGPPPEVFVMFPLQMIPGMVFAPAQILAGLFINAGIFHLCLMVLKLGKKGYESTFRVVCYAYAPMVLMLVPVVGWVAGTVWYIVALIVGLREVNNTTTGKAALVFFVPIIVLCGCGLLLMAVGLAMIAVGVAAG